MTSNDEEMMLIYDTEMCQYASLFDEIGNQLSRIGNAYDESVFDTEMCQLASVYDDLDFQLNQIGSLYDNPTTQELNNDCFEWNTDLISDQYYLNDKLCTSKNVEKTDINTYLFNHISTLDIIDSQVNQIDEITTDDLNNLDEEFEWHTDENDDINTTLFENINTFDINSDMIAHFLNSNSINNQWGGVSPALYTLQREVNRDFKFGISFKSLEFISNNTRVNNFMNANNLCRNFIDQIYLNHITTIKRNPRLQL